MTPYRYSNQSKSALLGKPQMMRLPHVHVEPYCLHCCRISCDTCRICAPTSLREAVAVETKNRPNVEQIAAAVHQSGLGGRRNCRRACERKVVLTYIDAHGQDWTYQPSPFAVPDSMCNKEDRDARKSRIKCLLLKTMKRSTRGNSAGNLLKVLTTKAKVTDLDGSSIWQAFQNGDA